MIGLQILFFVIFVKTQKADSKKNFQFQVKYFLKATNRKHNIKTFLSMLLGKRSTNIVSKLVAFLMRFPCRIITQVIKCESSMIYIT